MESYIHHDDADCKATLRLHAVAPDALVFYDIAVFRQIPGRSLVFAPRVNGVGRSLDVDAICPQTHKANVE